MRENSPPETGVDQPRLNQLVADLDSGKLDTTIKGIDELYGSLELACDRLRHLVKSRRPDRYVTTRT